MTNLIVPFSAYGTSFGRWATLFISRLNILPVRSYNLPTRCIIGDQVWSVPLHMIWRISTFYVFTNEWQANHGLPHSIASSK